jgi:chromosome segregation ATPase
MDAPVPDIERQIQADIEQLRGKFPQTQDLYREVCVLLFFRYGMAPTTNKLYQFVRKGSMSAPAEALAKFWENLREKSRVRIEQPGLPDDLKSAAGELVVTLWEKAQAQAQESFAAARSEAQSAVMEAQTARAAAESSLSQTKEALTIETQRLVEMTANHRTVEQRLAAEAATRSALEAQLAQVAVSLAEAQKAIEQARQDFAAELEKLRAANEIADERHQAAESRALIEIDRERMQSAKAQKDLEAVRTASNDAVERHRLESRDFQDQIAEGKQRIGVLEGRLGSIEASSAQLAAELAQERKALRDMTDAAGTQRREADTWREKLLVALNEIESLKAANKRKARRKQPELAL